MSRRTSRRPSLVATALLLAATTLAATPTATAVEAVPSLVGLDYTSSHFARVGWTNQPVAEVRLDSPASAATTVATWTSDPTVATVPDTVTVAAGETTATVPVTAVSAGSVTLFAALGADTVTAAPDLVVGEAWQVPALSGLELEPASAQPGDTATATVVLDFLAPPGGTALDLASSGTAVEMPSSITVPADQHRASFPVTTTVAGEVVISATLDGASRSATLTVADTQPPRTDLGGVTVRHAKRRATFRFTSSEPASTFRCKLDGASYRSCTSPRTYRRLERGRHTFRVRAVDAAGNVDPTAEVRTFRVRR